MPRRSGSGIQCAYGAAVILRRTIIACGLGGEAVRCEGGTSADLSCCDLCSNAGGDWVGYVAGQAGVNGNISQDPLFCGASEGDFALHADSPCAPDNNPDFGLIGPWPVGCASSPVEVATWGAIKAMFRP